MVEELNSGLLRTNPDSDRVEDLNQGSPDFKFSALNFLARLPPLKIPVKRFWNKSRFLNKWHVNLLLTQKS